MAKPAATLHRKIARFGRTEDGTFTVEAVMWLPVFLFLFCLIADASLIFGKQAQVMRIMQDANRAMSIGRITSADGAESYIQSMIATFSENAVVTTTVSSGVIVSTVEMPAGDLTATGFISSFTDLTIRVTAQHLSEA